MQRDERKANRAGRGVQNLMSRREAAELSLPKKDQLINHEELENSSRCMYIDGRTQPVFVFNSSGSSDTF